ncbi:MAG: YjbQ family protein [Candidatus Coatesbacteria bacterium]|nr:YjbQ family protein [Candidatus Coatesbacteria bacterium]
MISTKEMKLETAPGFQIVDITRKAEDELSNTGLNSGILVLFVPGATGALTTIEYESGLIQDLKDLFQKIIPEGLNYNHDRKWHDGNGHSHLRASLIGPSLSIPFSKGNLLLGTWQQIIFIDFDPPARSRKIILQFMGE